MGNRFDIADARKIKEARNQELDKLEKGEASLRAVLREPPASLKSAELYRVLLSTHGLGKESARIVCERAHVWPLVELGNMTKRERADVIRELPERVD